MTSKELYGLEVRMERQEKQFDDILHLIGQILL